MKKKYQNIFFIFGIAVLVVMVTQLDFQQVWQGLRHAGYWFVAVLVLWIFSLPLPTKNSVRLMKHTVRMPIH